MSRPAPILLPDVMPLTVVRRHLRAVLGAGTGILLYFIVMSLPDYPSLTRFGDEAMQSLPNVLAPLIIIALFIERAVEVLLSAWRGNGAQQLREEMRQVQAIGTPREIRAAKNACDRYGVESKKIAFLIGFVLALLISLMGVRGIEMLVGDGIVANSPPAQQKLFVRVDVLITALLLAGGAEGIHKVVNAFTKFIDATEERIRDRNVEPARVHDSPVADADR